MKGLGITLLTGRTIDQGWAKEHGKLSKEYLENVALCEIDPIDLDKLGIKENDNVRITTDYGSVILKSVKSIRGPHRKIIYVPYGPWANLLLDSKTDGSGMPTLKGIAARIEPAPRKKVSTLPELLRKHYGKG
jgi:formylmethanofuran dehydrogenase subunit D